MTLHCTRTLAAAAVLAVSGILAANGPATAAEHQKPKPSFEDADKNGDGKISLKEAQEQGYDKYQFVAQDVNQDGTLTKQDWRYISRRSNFVLTEIE